MSNPKWTEPPRVMRVVKATSCTPEQAVAYLEAEEGSERDAIESYRADQLGASRAESTRVAALEEALRAVVPYAHSRAEDLADVARCRSTDQQAFRAWQKADAAVSAAYRLLGIS